MGEVWRDVVGWEGLYQVSNLGRIKSLRRVCRNGVIKNGKMLRPRKCFGYMRIVLTGPDGGRKGCSVHRLVAEAFIPNPDRLPQINHKDEVRDNNCVHNLEWCTPSYNINYGSRNEIVSKKLKAHKEKTVARKVAQVDTETGEILEVWPSLRAVERGLNIPHSNIWACCNGLRHTRGGYAWAYTGDNKSSERVAL